MKYVYQAVERIPKTLTGGVVYHSKEFEIGALLCACGCGHRVSLLVPDSHQISSEAGLATVRPSIAVCDAPCKSHYYISAGRVEWLPAFSDAMAASVMRDQVARHSSNDKNVRSWSERFWAGLARAYGKLKTILRI